ncbi:FDLD family class I lanthipeptide [Tumebacillus avium]|nr:FDLD family class I lanthipeptide [Tumebacillus avium]
MEMMFDLDVQVQGNEVTAEASYITSYITCENMCNWDQ